MKNTGSIKRNPLRGICRRHCLLICLLMAFSGAQAQMQALFGYSTFYLPQDDRPYMETYLQVDA